ncbi:hypothetical protein SDC9_166004 [bioreactor metagenome]|uniref:Uncharacterized protein n=1 Tax=bioreactor metagenome TaxID=1076179 RepID=A0A645G3N7_9ZZZZ
MRHPLRPQPGDDLAGLAAQRVVYTDYPGQLRTDCEVEQRIVRALLIDDLFISFGDLYPLVLKHEMGAADDDPLAAQTGYDAVRDGIFHLGVFFRVVQIVLFRAADHRLRYRVREMLLKAGRQFQHIFSAVSVEGDDLGHPRLGDGQRAGLVEHRGVRVG